MTLSDIALHPIRNLRIWIARLRASSAYRPEKHYMRGPGPKSRGTG